MGNSASMAIVTHGTSSNYLQRAPSPSGLAEVLDAILDKGLVIDAYVRVSVIGIEVLTIDRERRHLSSLRRSGEPARPDADGAGRRGGVRRREDWNLLGPCGPTARR